MEGVTVVIPSRNRARMLEATLVRLHAAIPPGVPVVVVDSASTDDTSRTAATAGARVVRCDRPGASVARNAGWRAADTPVVAFLDDDCRPEDGWLDALVAPFEDPEVGFVAGRVGLPVGKEQGTASLAVLERDHPMVLRGRVALADLALSGNVAYRRNALEQTVGFDEVLGAGAPLRAAEDKDLSWRVLRAGWTGRYTPAARVTHEQWRGRGRALETYFGYGVGVGGFIRKVSELAPEDGASFARDGGIMGQLRAAARSARDGYEYGILIGLATAAGVLVGRWRSRRFDVVDGRFVP